MSDQHPYHRAEPLIPKILDTIDAVEETARAAAEAANSSALGMGDEPAGLEWSADGGLVSGEREGLWDCEGSGTLCMAEVVAEHVALHDPAQVLRRCAADREIIEECKGALEMGSWEETPYRAEAVLKQLAIGYGIEVGTDG